MNYGAVVDGLAASGNLRVLPPDASLLLICRQMTILGLLAMWSYVHPFLRKRL